MREIIITVIISDNLLIIAKRLELWYPRIKKLVTLKTILLILLINIEFIWLLGYKYFDMYTTMIYNAVE